MRCFDLETGEARYSRSLSLHNQVTQCTAGAWQTQTKYCFMLCNLIRDHL